MLSIHIVQVGKKRSSRQETLAKREVYLGRERDCDLVLDDVRVSSVHCRLVAVTGGVIVLDEGSTNGTWVNGERVRHPVLLSFEDTLVLGPYMLSVQSLVTQGRMLPGDERSTGTRVVMRPDSPSEPSGAAQWWQVLGVNPRATPSEARSAYLHLLSQYHPDKVAQLGPELRELAARKSRELKAAWDDFERLTG